MNRFRGSKRTRGGNRTAWTSILEGVRLMGAKRPGFCNRPLPYSPIALRGLPTFGRFKLNKDVMNQSDNHLPELTAGVAEANHKRSPSCFSDTKRSRRAFESPRSDYATAANKATSFVGNPIVILNPKDSREIYIGGVHTVTLPLWAYKKCLTMVRGEPHELGPRLCLRLLQSLFSLHYLVTHNYNGSGGKAPIDPTVMGAVLRQAQIQFGSGYFFTEPMALGKLRDYLNNAFRVMAFRQRKGERVRSPFWNDQGEPVHGLDAPIEFAGNADVIVISDPGDLCLESKSLTTNSMEAKEKQL